MEDDAKDVCTMGYIRKDSLEGEFIFVLERFPRAHRGDIEDEEAGILDDAFQVDMTVPQPRVPNRRIVLLHR